MVRLAVARLWFCSNSFTPRRTRAEDVRSHEWVAGLDAFSALTSVDGEAEGLQRFLADRPDWEATIIRWASTPAAGPLSAEMFGAWMAEVEDQLRRGRFDAVFLSLHGACQAEGDPSADVTILRRVRAIVGHIPFVASFDLHANLSEETAILLDGASANRSWPNGGGADAALRALHMLEGTLSGKIRPVGALARVPMVLSDALLGEAMAELWQGPLQAVPQQVLEASVFAGFAWGDSPYAGPSALVWTDRDAGLARDTAAYLALALSRWRNRPLPVLRTPAAALATIDLQAARGPIVLLDPSDDPLSGGLMDTPELLQAILARTGPDAAENPLAGPVLFAAFHDPEAVAQAYSVGEGNVLRRSLGGLTTRMYGISTPVAATVQWVQQNGPHGGFAVLQVGSVDILVTSVRPRAITPALLEAMGIAAASYRVLAIKGGSAARVAFDGIAAEIIACDCPGPAAQDLLRLPFHYVPAIRRGVASTPRASSAEMASRARPAASAPDEPGADAAHPRHEERRVDVDQPRPEPFGLQGP